MTLSSDATARPQIVESNHDPVFLDLLRILLQDEGYDAVVPPKQEEPYPFIKQVRPAAVILDVPFRQETETLATLDKLRLDWVTTAIPVVVCTTSPRELHGLEGREAEGLYLLAKPFDLEQLLRVLTVALALPTPRSTR